ncbi:basal cell adhesion molecule [Eublepharis macularius]|uniref:Basal cell adhesion molecule n=1 Tax=Eublepharis macularius TaxID=481883 RepID=A0AA97LGF5_EUBMA|nr:basal cell adhesion molecule [Eublepharis macularius]
MGARRSPKALRWPAALLGLCLLACPGCHGEVEVSVPAEVEVLLGQRASISCTHTITGGKGYHLVEWFITDKNGEQRRVAFSERDRWEVDKNTEYTDRISMDSDYSLIIESANVNDERAFSCRVMAAAAGDGGGTAQLKVYDPPESPEVRWNTRTLSVTGEHASEIATCNSRNANPVPTISWYKDSYPLQVPAERNNNLYAVSRTVKEASGLHSVSSTLYLRPNKTDKDSHFHCRVNYSMPRGEVGSLESESFKLTLHYYTENVHFSLDSPKVIKEGDEVRLLCQGDGNPPPEYVFSKMKTADQFEDLGANPNGLLVLQQVTKRDSGTYRCQVLDFDSPPEVELEKEVTIHVNYLDTLVLNPNKTVKVPLGGSIELACAGSGSQTPTLSWRKGKEQVENSGILSLTSLTYHKAGTYTCEASVPSVPGLRRDQSVRVIVEGKPELEQHQSPSHYHSFGQKVTLTCSALGHPEPRITWSIPGEPLTNSSANRVTSRLSVEVTPELAESGVKCLAENQHGSDERTFQLETASPTVSATAVPVDGSESQGGSTVAVIAVCVCVLLLLLIVGFFYFMQRRGRLPCGGGEKRSLTPKEGNPDDTVVEMKTDKRNEQTGLLSPGGGGGGGTNEC